LILLSKRGRGCQLHGQNEREKHTSTKQKQTKEKVSQPGLILRGCSLITLLSSAFSCYLHSHYFFLTDCWYIYIQRRSTSCFIFWELTEPRALVTFDKILPSIRMKFNDFLFVWSRLCFAFDPRRSKDFSPFWSVSWWWNELVSKAWPQSFRVNKKC